MCRRIILSAILTLALLPMMQAQCPNIDFSYGNFTNWKCYVDKFPKYSVYDSLKWTLFTGPHQMASVVNKDVDEYSWLTCYTLPVIPEGFSASATIKENGAVSYRYTIPVDSSNYYVRVDYAAVLQLFPTVHTALNSPRFGIRFQDSAGRLLPVGNVDISIADIKQMSTCNTHDRYWRDWDVCAVSLKQWMGQRVDLVVYSSDYKNTDDGHGHVACFCGHPTPWLTWCQCSHTAAFEAPVGYVSYIWKNGAGKVIDTARRFTLGMALPDSGCVCIMKDVRGYADTQRVSVRQTSLQPSMAVRHDTLSSYICLANTSVLKGETVMGQRWRIGKLGGRTEYETADSAFEYYFRDSGLYRVLLTVTTANGCEDTCSRLFVVPKAALKLLSVRPDADSLEGKNVTYPRVLLCNNVRKYLKDAILRVYVLDSAGKTIRQMSDTIPSNSSGDTVEMLFKSFTYSVPDYTGIYRLKAVCDLDTLVSVAHCFKRPDTLDVRLLSIFPKADTSEGGTDMPSYMKLQYYANFIPTPSCRVNVCVQVLDSGFVLLNQSMHGINLVNNIEVTSAGSHKVPDYTGCYYLKAFFTNLKDSFNKVTSNDTAVFKAYCFKHLKTDVQLVSVRPQHDSAEVGSWTSHVVVVKNVGDLDVRNVAVEVQMDTTQLGHSYTGKYAYYWDTIPFLAAGDSVKWVMSARYQVPDCWAGSYYRMYASIAVENDEVSTNNNAFYEAKCSKTVDFRLISFQIPSDTLWGGVPVYPKVRIVNNSIVVTSYFEFRMEVSDSAGNMLQSWQESGTNHVNAGDTLDFQCMKSIQVPNYNGVFRLRAYVSYLPVEYRMTRSDTLVQYYRCFHNDTIDVSLTDLLYPVTTEVPYGNTKLRPKVRVRNMSNVKLDSLRLTALVYDYTGALHDSVSEIMPTIAAGSLLNYQFTNPYKVPNATAKYDLLVRLEAPEGDVSLNDNSIRRQFRARFHFDTVDVRPLAFVMADTLWSGATVYPVLRMVNASAADVSGFSVWLEAADSAGKVMRRWEEGGISVPAGDTLDFPCSQSLKLPDYTGKFRMRAAVSQYPMDYILTGSDTLLQYFQCRRRDTVDVALAELLYPVISEVLTGKTEVHPQVRVVNRGNVEVRNLVLSALVYDQSGSLADSLPGMILSLEAGVDTAYTFPSAYLVPDVTGSYSLVVRLAAPAGDVSEKDNELQRKLLSKKSLAVELVLKSNWQLGQNIPNPAADKTLVPVTLPMPGTVRLQVFAADGRLLYRSEHAVAEGKSLLPLDLAGYAAGVYYYSVEYKGERKVRKMVVE
ncbi:MAG: T9SS type A sorting domain-containing protein [Bacteroidales bacterium]|nr:T9SS type A sorting domain-containing protein [Bacteroidales bacterium]